jgi:putative spermidine/putrescine transport system substrate-binding protein
MKRLLLLLGALVALAAPAAAQRDLTVVAGGGALQDHMRRTLFDTFAAASGRPVRDTAYDYNVGPIRAMVQARNVTWDVVLVEAPDLIRGCEDGVFERIDWSVVNREKFLPGGTTTCGAGAIGWGVSVFRDLVRNPTGPANWQEFWDVQRFPGRRTLRRGARMTLEIALMGDGVPPAEVYRRARHPGRPAARLRGARPPPAAPAFLDRRPAAAGTGQCGRGRLRRRLRRAHGQRDPGRRAA